MVLQRSRSRQHDDAEIARIVREEEVEVVVVGLPLNMDGSHGASAKAAIADARRLATVVGVPIELHDERRTTVTAERSMREAGLDGVERRAAGRQGGGRDHAPVVARRASERAGEVAAMKVAGEPGFDRRTSADWAADEWDDVGEVPAVEPLPRQSRLVKWTVWGVMAIVIAMILIAGWVGWWYLERVKPEGEVTEAVPFTVLAGDTVDSLAARLAAGGLRRGRLGVHVVRRPPRRAGDRARLLPAAPQRPRGQRARAAAHAAGPDVRQGHLPGGLHRSSRWPTGWRRSCRG